MAQEAAVGRGNDGWVSTRGGKTEYKTVGPYDIVTILEAPDDESVTAVMLELGTGAT